MPHLGSFSYDSFNDILGIGSGGTVLALPAGGVFPANALTGDGDVTCINTQATPGTVTTRTATQMFADLTAQIGQVPPVGFTWTLRITHTAAATLTLAAGTGVTFGGAGVNTIATTTWRDYLCVFTSATTLTMTSSGTGTWS